MNHPPKRHVHGIYSHDARTDDKRFWAMTATVLVVHWGRWASHVVYLIYFQKNWVDNIMTNEFEVRFLQQMRHVFPCSCEEVIDANDLHVCQTNIHNAHWRARRRAFVASGCPARTIRTDYSRQTIAAVITLMEV